MQLRQKLAFALSWGFSILLIGALPLFAVQAPKEKSVDELPLGAIARIGSLAFNHGTAANGWHFMADGKRIISTGTGMVRIWDAKTGREIRSFAIPQVSGSADTVLRSDDKTLVHFDYVHGVTVVDCETEKIRKQTLVNPAKS